MAFNNIPPNGFPALPDVEDLEAVEKDVTTLKSSVLGLTQDVTDLNAQKANQITIAPFFNSETSYDVGDLVYYNGLTYRCTNAHEGEWDADDFSGTTIANELDELKSGLTNIDTIAVTNEHALITQYQVSAKRWGKLLIVSGFFSLDEDITGTQTTLFHANQTVLAEVYTSVVSSTKNAFGRLKLATNGDIIADDPMSGQQWFSFTLVALTT